MQTASSFLRSLQLSIVISIPLKTEKQIIKSLQKGNKNVFKDIYATYYNDLCQFIYHRFIKDKDETEDIVQGVLIKLWEKRDELEKINSLKSYLYKSVYHAALNYLEHQAVKRKYQAEEISYLKEAELPEEQDSIRNDQLKEVKSYINELPEQTQKVFILKYKEGKKYKEIAEALNISPKTVETLIYRGLKQIRKKIKNK